MLDDIDCVALGDFNQQIFGNEYITDTFEIKGKKIKSYIIDHHLAHCASVYYTSHLKMLIASVWIVVWVKLKQIH